jgi:tetratricopeptide (TPR) repeat protein
MTDATEVSQLIKSGEKSLEDGEVKSALKHFLEASNLDPENPEVNYFIGMTYTKMGEYEMGSEHLEKVLASEITYINKVHARMILGYIYTIQEEYEKALDMFKGIVKSGFGSAQAYAAIGYLMDRMGDFKKAVMNLYKAIEIDPKNANAHNSLGYIYAEANLNLEEALKECKLAVSINKDNPAYLDSLGWVYYKLGKVKQAKIYLNKALKKTPDNEEIRTHLQTVLNSGKGQNLKN